MGIVAAGVVSSCSDDDNDTVIEQSQLPAQAKAFISLYFGGDKITRVEMESNPTTYDVNFASGAEVEFDAEGQWTDVQAAFGSAVPQAIVPVSILSYVEGAFPNAMITEISKTISGGYEVDLSNGADLFFDQTGNLLGVD